MTSEAILVDLEVLPNHKEASAPYLYIARGFSTNAAESLRALVKELNLQAFYNVIVPVYSDLARDLQKSAIEHKRKVPSMENMLEQFCYRLCGAELAVRLERLAVTLSITQVKCVALSAGASVLMYAIPALKSVKVSNAHLFAPDPILPTAVRIRNDLPVFLYWQIKDPMIPMNPNMAQVLKWLGPAFAGCDVTSGDKHDFDKVTLSKILL